MLKKHDVDSLVEVSQPKSESRKEKLSVYQTHRQPSYKVQREFANLKELKQEVTFVSCCHHWAECPPLQTLTKKVVDVNSCSNM